MNQIVHLSDGTSMAHSLDPVSLQRLMTCELPLIKLFCAVSVKFPLYIVYGHRNEKEQNEAYAKGNSKVQWPNSKHNTYPSKAVDAVPKEQAAGKIKLDWNDAKRFYFLAGHVMQKAKDMGIPLRFGGDWDSDTELKDNNFNDLAHYETA